ncbi:hypothetical protein B0H21DRAFT_559684 [Amylocystis lapponica]|nr:hypothetical protein B0H21DRAFT_559684 [Amylocystis lapponica]
MSSPVQTPQFMGSVASGGDHYAFQSIIHESSVLLSEASMCRSLRVNTMADQSARAEYPIRSLSSEHTETQCIDPRVLLRSSSPALSEDSESSDDRLSCYSSPATTPGPESYPPSTRASAPPPSPEISPSTAGSDVSSAIAESPTCVATASFPSLSSVTGAPSAPQYLHPSDLSEWLSSMFGEPYGPPGFLPFGSFSYLSLHSSHAASPSAHPSLWDSAPFRPTDPSSLPRTPDVGTSDAVWPATLTGPAESASAPGSGPFPLADAQPFLNARTSGAAGQVTRKRVSQTVLVKEEPEEVLLPTRAQDGDGDDSTDLALTARRPASKTVKRPRRPANAQGRWECEVQGCCKSFGRDHDRRRHYLACHAQRTSMCPVCHKDFTRKDGMQRHRASKHKGKEQVPPSVRAAGKRVKREAV